MPLMGTSGSLSTRSCYRMYTISISTTSELFVVDSNHVPYDLARCVMCAAMEAPAPGDRRLPPYICKSTNIDKGKMFITCGS